MSAEIITRGEAKARGLKRYFTGKPCKNGHVSERYTRHGNCCECGLEQYQRYYHQRNGRERHLTKYWEAPDKYRAYARKYYQGNLKKCREYAAKIRAGRPEKILEERKKTRERARRIQDLISVLRSEMPDLLKEFGL